MASLVAFAVFSCIFRQAAWSPGPFIVGLYDEGFC